jgi:Vps53-like, N-terminal
MARRKHEIDVKLLLFAIQRTSAFESLLAKRFSSLQSPEGRVMKVIEQGSIYL